ncbi:MAG: RecQ family ATP-dependent DNA helicase [Ilumatobacter sp.]|nr:RecQ family ATP-dependent DNA helicase [Ilumatobacter sp.]MBT5276446.1 RecQ family ATP-dependent DNA helicase [Ilumatobacter sp.]MBT5554111.1 RecQ family ATP-dependent DNA helicase [Ilumatobacter sp.]
MGHMHDPMLEALRSLTGRPDADFRPDQRAAIEALVERRDRVLVVQRTGWGKSAVYFLATHLLRQQQFGPTLLISPLLALMRNQIDAAERLGLRCMTVNSSSATTVDELSARLEADDVDLVLVSPERLANPDFAGKAMPILGRRPGLVVIDEVHCISDWGHDFRPDYRRIGRLIANFGDGNVPVLGCTATANSRVVEDVAQQLGASITTYRGQLGRDGLALSAVRLPRQAERLAWLAEHLAELPGSGIIYCLTIRDVENVTSWLRRQGHDVAGYTGATISDDREEMERRLQANDLKALVATSALGMGYDKPDLGFVVHFQMPGSPVAYYQQVGRAGRALEHSQALLLCGKEDVNIQDYFIDAAFPDPQDVDAVLAILDEAAGPVSLRDIATNVDVKWTQIELVLKQLDVEGVVRRVKGQSYERTLTPWIYPHERVAGVTDARRWEQQLMFDYADTSGCRMRFLTDLLDDDMAGGCGICDNCRGEMLQPSTSSTLIADAEAFLRNRPLMIEPRKQSIPISERNQQGRTLAHWGDSGWGPMVQQGRRDGHFADELVDAMAEMITEWAPSPAPEWVAAVPSDRTTSLVPGFAARVAARLGLVFVPLLERAAERPPQVEMQNSPHQSANVVGAFTLGEPPMPGPVLLIDDLVDSGWTLTETGRLLSRSGSGPVYPLVLAISTGRRT